MVEENGVIFFFEFESNVKFVAAILALARMAEIGFFLFFFSRFPIEYFDL